MEGKGGGGGSGKLGLRVRGGVLSMRVRALLRGEREKDDLCVRCFWREVLCSDVSGSVSECILMGTLSFFFLIKLLVKVKVLSDSCPLEAQSTTF